MLVFSRTTGELVAGSENGVHHLRKVTRLDAEEENLDLGFESDAEVPAQHWEMLERIRVAAGQTS